MSIFDHSFIDNKNKLVHMSDYQDKTLLIVNVASMCGFTSQYEWLQSFHEKYADKGLVVIGFPCNQFGDQEPGTDEEIKNFCTINYNVTFTMSKKVYVNGEKAHPLVVDLVAASNFNEVPWNFTKFIVHDNEVIGIAPDETREQIEVYLKQSLGI